MGNRYPISFSVLCVFFCAKCRQIVGNKRREKKSSTSWHVRLLVLPSGSALWFPPSGSALQFRPLVPPSGSRPLAPASYTPLAIHRVDALIPLQKFITGRHVFSVKTTLQNICCLKSKAAYSDTLGEGQGGVYKWNLYFIYWYFLNCGKAKKTWKSMTQSCTWSQIVLCDVRVTEYLCVCMYIPRSAAQCCPALSGFALSNIFFLIIYHRDLKPNKFSLLVYII